MARATLVCKRCNGAKTLHCEYSGVDHVCHACQGAGEFPEPDASILATLVGPGGKMRATRPADRRAYYVWRMARYHGGVDRKMPVQALDTCEHDPWLNMLDKFTVIVSEAAFGRAAALRALAIVKEGA